MFVAAAAAVAAVVNVVGRMVFGSRPESNGEYLKECRPEGRGIKRDNFLIWRSFSFISYYNYDLPTS